jgi:iron complex outermembrane receptor protein
MQLRLNRALCATTALATGLLIATGALAQSTGTQVQELVVTGSRGLPDTGGLAQQVQVAKDESVITQQFIQRQVGTANFAQLINLLPGVTYSSEDPTGILSGDFRMHGLDCNHLSVTIDGSPVNDSGNYACFPGEYLVAELTDHIRVDIGATDVDSPTASAVGGQVNIISKTPDKDFHLHGSVSGGSDNYKRIYGEVDSGALGPYGTRAYFATNLASGDKYRGEGYVRRTGFDARVYQPLQGADFISLAASYVKNRTIFYFGPSRAQLSQFGETFDYNPVWIAPTITPGKADLVPIVPVGAAAVAVGLPPNAGQAGAQTNYWSLHPNPVDFGSIRGSSLFTLPHNLTLTVDPSFFYTLANGGGSTSISEKDMRLNGKNIVITPSGTGSTVSGPGVDLNGDGDTLDTVQLYTPNNTNTRRFVLTSSLLWELSHEHHFQLAYTYDYARHRQTGEYSGINLLTGDPNDVFGGKDGYGVPVATSDGSIIRGRDRFSKAILNQFAVNYIGSFMDDKLKVNVGVRIPQFERDLNQKCYTFNGTTVYCTTVDPTLVQTAYNNAVIAKSAGASTPTTPSLNALMGNNSITFNTQANRPNFRFPFAQTYHFNKALPNAGVTYRWNDHLFYVSYAAGFSAPKTDDLYSSSPELVEPETTDTISAGWRYQASSLTTSVNYFNTHYHNRIVQSIDVNDPTLSIDRNVGSVVVQGVDAEVGWKPIDHLSVYASTTYQDSEIQNDIPTVVSGQTVFIPTKGKEFVLTPKWQFSGRVQYDWGDFSIGLQGKYQSSRWISDVNDDRIPGFGTFALDASYKLRFINDDTVLRVNVSNLFDRFYIDRSSTVNATKPLILTTGSGGTVTLNPSTPFLTLGYPRFTTVTLSTKF